MKGPGGEAPPKRYNKNKPKSSRFASAFLPVLRLRAAFRYFFFQKSPPALVLTGIFPILRYLCPVGLLPLFFPLLLIPCLMRFFWLLIPTLMACQSPSSPLDIQGHRGCRGHWPENSVTGMLRALDMGVTTLEMDASISADSQVLLSHEPWFSSEICRDPQGRDLPPDSAEAYNLFRLPYAEIRTYDCGSKPHPRFPDQQQVPVYKPLLAEVIDSVEAYRAAHGLPPVDFNIETKCDPRGDNVFHPEPEAFVALLMAVIDAKGIRDRCIIQSFDVRTLQVMHRQYPGVRLALLVENPDGLQANLDRLGFVPDIYSPDHALVDEALRADTRAQGMALIPWTANEPADIARLLALGVDGIISDYPDRVVAARQ